MTITLNKYKLRLLTHQSSYFCELQSRQVLTCVSKVLLHPICPVLILAKWFYTEVDRVENGEMR